MMMDGTLRGVFFGATGVGVVLVLPGGAAGYPDSLRGFNPELWFYALAGAIGPAALCIVCSFIGLLWDVFRGKRRGSGWCFCMGMSVPVFFVLQYVLPARKSPF